MQKTAGHIALLVEERLERLGVTKLVDVRMTEEQSARFDHEVEQEHQVELLEGRTASMSSIRDIREFIRTGNVPTSPSHIFRPWLR